MISARIGRCRLCIDNGKTSKVSRQDQQHVCTELLSDQCSDARSNQWDNGPMTGRRGSLVGCTDGDGG